MIKVPPRSSKYFCYEVSLGGRGLSRTVKAKIRCFFLNCHIAGEALACTDHRGSFRACYYTPASCRVAGIRRLFRGSPLKGVSFRVRSLERHDWFDKWKRDYHIRPFGTRFTIVPVWEKMRFRSGGRLPIFLEPGSAFGSGYHETTRLMVRLLESLRFDPASFLDIGTGTGILSIAAWKLGMRKVVAFDHDKPSVIVAKKNFAMNGCLGGDFFCARLQGLKLQERFTVVGANLLSQTLLENQGTIKGTVKAGGHLIVSGIGEENLGPFKTGFSLSGFKCLKILKGRKWSALAYKKV